MLSIHPQISTRRPGSPNSAANADSGSGVGMQLQLQPALDHDQPMPHIQMVEDEDHDSCMYMLALLDSFKLMQKDKLKHSYEDMQTQLLRRAQAEGFQQKDNAGEGQCGPLSFLDALEASSPDLFTKHGFGKSTDDDLSKVRIINNSHMHAHTLTHFYFVRYAQRWRTS